MRENISFNVKDFIEWWYNTPPLEVEKTYEKLAAYKGETTNEILSFQWKTGEEVLSLLEQCVY